MRCARCHRSIKGAFTWHLGHPIGPVCAEKMALKDKKERARVVRDTKTLDLFKQDQSTDTK